MLEKTEPEMIEAYCDTCCRIKSFKNDGTKAGNYRCTGCNMPRINLSTFPVND